eukprot:6213453-Pleurochrysis_carterae.AAC.3
MDEFMRVRSCGCPLTWLSIRHACTLADVCVPVCVYMKSARAHVCKRALVRRIEKEVVADVCTPARLAITAVKRRLQLRCLNNAQESNPRALKRQERSGRYRAGGNECPQSAGTALRTELFMHASRRRSRLRPGATACRLRRQGRGYALVTAAGKMRLSGPGNTRFNSASGRLLQRSGATDTTRPLRHRQPDTQVERAAPLPATQCSQAERFYLYFL